MSEMDEIIREFLGESNDRLAQLDQDPVELGKVAAAIEASGAEAEGSLSAVIERLKQ